MSRFGNVKTNRPWLGLWLACLFSLLPAGGAFAEDLYGFTSEEQRTRFQRLSEELRCPKCQNQSIADSDAGISIDMRQKVARMIQDGATDEEIVNYFVQRYGVYVTYRPPLDEKTLALWLVPLLVLGGGLAVIAWQVKKAASKPIKQEESE